MPIEQAVVDDFLNGDVIAFEQIYERTRSLIFHTVFQMTGSQQQAEDILHDTYVRAFEHRHSFRQSSSISTWIHKIAVNHTLNFLQRYKKQHTFMLSHINETEDTTGHVVIKKEESHLVRIILNKIKPDFRVCIILKDIEEKSYEEIAEILDISVGTVKSRLNRGRSQFNKIVNTMKKANEL